MKICGNNEKCTDYINSLRNSNIQMIYKLKTKECECDYRPNSSVIRIPIFDNTPVDSG